MYMKLSKTLYFLMTGLALQVPAVGATADSAADSAYFARKHKMLTATWHSPFSYVDTRTNHAPLGPYMGNGDVGVVAFTSDNSQTLKISKVDFVTDGWTDWAGSGPAALPVGGVRIAVDAPLCPGHYDINRPDKRAFCYEMDQLRSELRMNTATAPQVQMTSWMSMDENIIVTEVSNPSKHPVHLTVDTYADTFTPVYATTAAVEGDVAQVSRQTKTEKVRWVCQAGISTRIIGAKARVERLDGSMVRSTFEVPATGTVRIAVCVSGAGTANDAQLPQSGKRLQQLSSAGAVDQLKKDKESWWRDMWTRSYVETHDSLLDRHYLSSVYLLASGYNRHSPVCGGMYGVWNMEDRMMYHGDIHLNYNSQAGFYSVFSANRPELALPFYKTIEMLIPEGQRRAREEMGVMHPSWKGKSCRGILFPVGALGIGVFYNYYWQQTMDAPFCIPLFSWYYEYTGDLDFLRQHAYPYIRLCGDFYEDYLKREPYGKSYRYSIITGGHENSWDVNPPSDLAFVEQTFRLLLRYSRLLGVAKQRRKLWADIVSHMPAYKVIMPKEKPNQGQPVYAKNEDGWDWPAHAIQLHALYPCEVLHLRSDSTALQIARNTLQYYQVDQKGFTGVMNELGLSTFVMGARAGFEPQVLIDSMKTLIRTAAPNFLIIDGHHCAEKTAVIETVNSMMLQSVDDILYLFPCWPAKPASFTRLRAKGAFVVSAEYDGRQVTSLTIHSDRGTPCRIKHPWPGKTLVVETGGKRVAVSTRSGICTFATKAGGTYTLSAQ